MPDVWPTDRMLTAACLAAQPYEHATVGLAHAVAAATVEAALTVDGWWWCEHNDDMWQVEDGPRCYEDCCDGALCPGPHRTLLIGPAEPALPTDGDTDG